MYLNLYTMKFVKPKPKPKTTYWINGDKWIVEKSSYNEWEAWNACEQKRKQNSGQGTNSYGASTKRELLQYIGWTGKDVK